jgi:hypothetical protein
MRWDLVPKNPEEVDESHIYYDAFGVEWKGVIDGIRGVIQKHPLEDFSKIPDYKFPELPKFDLEKDRENVAKPRKRAIYDGGAGARAHISAADRPVRL